MKSGFSGFAVFLIVAIGFFGFAAISTGLAQQGTSDTKSQVKIKPSQLIVRPKNSAHAPGFLSDPSGWIESKQRYFYDKMSKTLRKVRAGNDRQAAFLLMFFSFVYGVLHAAGPGHGKAVVSAWLLANEQQLRRGITIASMAAFIQALTAIVIVSTVLLFVQAAGTKARFIATSLEAFSFGLIALVGVFLIWRTLKSQFKAKQQNVADQHANHDRSHNHMHHNHAHGESCPTNLSAAASCDCGHAHMPTAQDVSGDWSWPKAVSLAFAVGIRPCSGAILVLLLSSTIGLYWVGVASAFAMAVGTGITVSAVAVLTVVSKNFAMKLTGQDNRWFDLVLFGVKLLAGIFIMLSGGFLFWATLPRVF